MTPPYGTLPYVTLAYVALPYVALPYEVLLWGSSLRDSQANWLNCVDTSGF
jgi:hypothetical protein